MLLASRRDWIRQSLSLPADPHQTDRRHTRKREDPSSLLPPETPVPPPSSLLNHSPARQHLNHTEHGGTLIIMTPHPRYQSSNRQASGHQAASLTSDQTSSPISTHVNQSAKSQNIKQHTHRQTHYTDFTLSLTPLPPSPSAVLKTSALRHVSPLRLPTLPSAQVAGRVCPEAIAASHLSTQVADHVCPETPAASHLPPSPLTHILTSGHHQPSFINSPNRLQSFSSIIITRTHQQVQLTRQQSVISISITSTNQTLISSSSLITLRIIT